MEYFMIIQFQIVWNDHYDLFFNMSYVEMYALISKHM